MDPATSPVTLAVTLAHWGHVSQMKKLVAMLMTTPYIVALSLEIKSLKLKQCHCHIYLTH